ncbi:CLUMA_CG012329, isoform A [Clunio marinus]|uniref:CLUMA_CG012329, isoform A n=1 Tax=Clunio marinus TaxID=568069 RepID=A0A1J1IET0_9DIPT|nr:CLUMA_CG012329, isoform A [Clunio marinus]
MLLKSELYEIECHCTLAVTTKAKKEGKNWEIYVNSFHCAVHPEKTSRRGHHFTKCFLRQMGTD